MAGDIDIEACAAMVAEAACRIPPSSTSLDAVAVALVSQSNALTWGATIIAIVGIVGAVSWGRIMKGRAEQEARNEARQVASKEAQKIIEQWLATKAPEIISRHVEKLRDSSIGRDDDDAAADEIGKEVG